MLDEKHSAAIEAILFGTSDAPGWLSTSVHDCQSRYAGLSLTEEFQSAINAFDVAAEKKPFELFVVGEGKFGKSTLVNCLLGEELSRVRVLPETRCFLRYVLTGQVATVARFYVRPKKGMHDWLIKALGAGRSVPELYQVTEHDVELSRAKELLAEEVARLDAGGYDPAILEVERDVKRSMRSAFQSAVRIVDTQGLDQLFPDELKKKSAGLSDASSRDLFIEWMNTTPRGKYLEWQFRRCDSVLWCVSAVRIGSAATEAALRYFSSYSKKIIVALTSIDRIPTKVGALDRVLTRASELYGDHVADICPVNGQQAWEAIASGDENALKKSGFSGLTNSIEEICTSQGNKVRNLSRYFAIRRTEHQYRDSLRSLHSAYQELDSRYKKDNRSIENDRDKAKKAIVSAINELFSATSLDVMSRIEQVSLSDDQFDAESKVGFKLAGKAVTAEILDVINNGVIPGLVRTGEAIAPYALPSFDADGQVAGSLVRVDFQSPKSRWRDPSKPFSFSLEGEWFKSTFLKIREFFGSDKARAERIALEYQRQSGLASEFRKHWKSHHSDTVDAVLVEVDRLYEELFIELRRVMSRVEKEAGGPLPIACAKIETALAAFAVLPAVSNGVVRAIERARHKVA